jgi:hypothetical protein
VAVLCSACGFRPPSTGCRSSRMRRREFSVWGSYPSNRPFSSRSHVWARPSTTCAHRGTGSCSYGLAMRGPHHAIAVGDERSQVSALSNSWTRRDLQFVRDGLQALRDLVLRPSAAACRRRHPAMERRNRNTSAASSRCPRDFTPRGRRTCDSHPVSKSFTNTACRRYFRINFFSNKTLQPCPGLCGHLAE